MDNQKKPNIDEEYINKLYDSQLEANREKLKSDYDQNLENLSAEQEKTAATARKSMNQAAVDNLKNRQGWNEVYNAYGLSSGARGQAQLAFGNQMESSLTALRAAKDTADAEIERQRSLLAKQYASAIQQAQAENDYARAAALYDAAKNADSQLLQQQENAAKLMASAGDFSLYGQLYGLTPEQIAKLQAEYEKETSSSGGGGGGYGYGSYSGRSGSTSSSGQTGTQSQTTRPSQYFVEGYGSMSADEVANLLDAGYIRMSGYDARGNPIYERTTKFHDKAVAMEK